MLIRLMLLAACASLCWSAGGAARSLHSHPHNEPSARSAQTFTRCAHHHHSPQRPANPADNPAPSHDHDCPVCHLLLISGAATLPAAAILPIEPIISYATLLIPACEPAHSNVLGPITLRGPPSKPA